MTSKAVQEIGSAIALLSADQLQELYSWLAANRPHPLAKRIEEDFAGGRFDQVVQEALADADNGRLRLL